MLNPMRLGKGQVVLAFLAGATAGAVTAYLTSPRNGRENREALLGVVRELKTRGADDVGRVPKRLLRAARAAGEAFGAPGPDDELTLTSLTYY